MRTRLCLIVCVVALVAVPSPGRASILEFDVTNEIIEAFVRLGPGLENDDFFNNVPFGAASAVGAQFGAGGGSLYGVVQNFALPFTGPAGAATSLMIDTDSALSASGGGTGASGRAQGRVGFSITAPTTYAINGFTQFFPANPPTGVGPVATRTEVHLLNVGTATFVYRYVNQDTLPAGITHTLGVGGTETGTLNGVLGPGDYEFRWFHEATRADGGNEAGFGAEANLSLVVIPLPGAALLLGSAGGLLLLPGVRSRRRDT